MNKNQQELYLQDQSPGVSELPADSDTLPQDTDVVNIDWSITDDEQEAPPPIESVIASEDEAADYIEDHAEEFPDSVPLGDLKAMEGHRRKQMTIAELQEEVQRQRNERKLTHGKVLDKKSVKGEFNELVRTLLSGGYRSTRTNNDAVNGLVANASTVYS